MSRAAFACLLVVVLCAVVLIVVLDSCGGPSATFPLGKIQHIVVVFQENRTPDNLFHDPVLINAGADIASSGLNSSGQTIQLGMTSLGTDYDLSHAHSAFVAMYDGGKMDGANNVQISCLKGANGCPPPNPQFQYVNPSEVQPYFQMAEQYTFGDRMFQTNQGPSFPAHQFILSGTSAPTATSNLFAAENPNGGAGCAASSTSSVTLIGPGGKESGSMYPCFEHLTLADELDSRGLSWKYYAPTLVPYGLPLTRFNISAGRMPLRRTPPNARVRTGTTMWFSTLPRIQPPSLRT